MKEYIELLEKIADEIAKANPADIDKEFVMEVLRKYLNPFEPRPKDRFNPFK